MNTPTELTFRCITYPGWNTSEHGRHATEFAMAVIGPSGAIVWRMTSGVTPLGERHNHTVDHNLTKLYNALFDAPSDMGITSHEEITISNASDSEMNFSDSCEWLDGRACACKYLTGLKGAELFPAFACEGFAGVERILTTMYKEHYDEER